MRTIIFTVLALALVIARPARAQTNATLVPSVSFGTIYDDNLFAKTNGEAGTMTLVRPALEGNYESPMLTISSLFSFDMQRSNFAELSTLDARRHGNFDIKQRATEAMTLAFGLRYDRTETPGDLNLDTGILGERQTAERWEIVPSFEYRTTPRTTVNASYNGVTETLVSDIRGDLHVVRVSVAHQASTRDNFSVSYLGRRFVDAIDTHASNAVLLGWTRQLASATNLTLQAGPRLSSVKGLDAEIVVGYTRVTNLAQIGLNYWHGETIILGIQGPVAVDNATAKVVWPVTPRTEFGFSTSVTDSTTLEAQNIRVFRGVLLGAWTPGGGPYTFSASYGVESQRGLIRESVYIDGQVIRQTLRLNVTIAPRVSRKFRPTGEPLVVHEGVAQ